MFPEPTELLLIGYSNESIWTPKSKSNTLTPKTNSQTYWSRETSHVMNGIIFCVCLTVAISVLPIVLKWCRKERKKMQVKRESHSQIEAGDEFGLAMQRKDSWCSCLYCIRKPGETIHESQFPVSSRNKQHQRTGRPVLHAYSSKWLRVECWQELVFSRVEIWWIDGR